MAVVGCRGGPSLGVLVGLSALAEGPMDSRSSVRAFVRPRHDIWRSAHQILMIFSQMLDIIVLNDLASVLCARKFSFAPQGELDFF